ncbi:transposase [Streptomyces sp. NBC_01550]
MWDRIEPLMPADPVRGRRWADHRRTLEAIAWKYRTCSPWRDLPEKLGSFKTAHKRLIRWAVDGTWERILAVVLAVAVAGDDVGWTASVDSTVCRAHQHAAGARKKAENPACHRPRGSRLLFPRIRGHLRRRGIRAVIPQPADQIGHRLRRGRAGGRPPGFDAEAYKERNTVDRCINRLKQRRGLAMRTDKLAIAYQAALHLAAILIWIRR